MLFKTVQLQDNKITPGEKVLENGVLIFFDELRYNSEKSMPKQHNSTFERLKTFKKYTKIQRIEIKFEHASKNVHDGLVSISGFLKSLR